MKSVMIVLLILITSPKQLLADSSMTRGFDVGEIYFIGPTYTGKGIYRSIDSGETATCMDSTLNSNINFMSIAADLTPGVLYGYSMPENLYISYDYGQEGSWEFISNDVHLTINSGRNQGEIYSNITKWSNDYGQNFDENLCQGLFGFPVVPEIDNQDSVGYTQVTIWGEPDTLWLLIPYDNFETLEVQNIYNRTEFDISDLSRGVENGELYNFGGEPQSIYHSTNFGLDWEYINEFNPRIFYHDLVGGRRDGEVYVHATFDTLMHTVQHSYIFHSIDYGRTFEVHHNFAMGEESLVANFSTSEREGGAPFSVQFSNYSIGDMQSYEWDFDNDGIIDSTEPEPEYTYQDTGYYSVKLLLHSTNDTRCSILIIFVKNIYYAH